MLPLHTNTALLEDEDEDDCVDISIHSLPSFQSNAKPKEKGERTNSGPPKSPSPRNAKLSSNHITLGREKEEEKTKVADKVVHEKIKKESRSTGRLLARL